MCLEYGLTDSRYLQTGLENASVVVLATLVLYNTRLKSSDKNIPPKYSIDEIRNNRSITSWITLKYFYKQRN